MIATLFPLLLLGRPTDPSITINVLFPEDHDSAFLEYGLSPDALTHQTPTAIRHPGHRPLPGCRQRP